MALGEDVLRYDEYGRERDELPDALRDLPTVAIGGDDDADERRVIEAMRPIFAEAGVRLFELPLANGAGDAVAVDRRRVEHDGRTLIALTNLHADPQVVTLGDGAGRDLISGRDVDLSAVRLGSLEPVLIAPAD